MNEANCAIGIALVIGLVGGPVLAHGPDVHQDTTLAATASPEETPKTAPTAARPGPDEETTRNYFTDLALVTQEGKQVRFYTDVLKDNVVLINTIYTNCQDACPLLTQKLTAVVDRLQGDLFGKEVFFVSISTDPDRDSPAVLAEFAKQQKADHPGWLFLTGEKQNVHTILRKLGQFAPQPEAHSTLLIAGNVATRHWTKIQPTEPPVAIAMKLEELAAER